MMKQSEIAMVILVAAISLVTAYWLGGILINSPDHRSATVEIAIPFGAEFSEPSKKIFNDNSVNPTEKITIGDADKDKPFDDSN